MPVTANTASEVDILKAKLEKSERARQKLRDNIVRGCLVGMDVVLC